MSTQNKSLAATLAHVTRLLSVGCYILGLGSLSLAIVVDTWGLFMGVAVVTAAASVLGVLCGIGSLLMHRSSKATAHAWKKTVSFSILSATYVPVLVSIWLGLGFHR